MRAAHILSIHRPNDDTTNFRFSHFFTFFWRKFQKVLFKYQISLSVSHLRSGVQGRVDKGSSEIRKVGGSFHWRVTMNILTFWRDLHRCAFAATWLGALFSPNSKQNCEIALMSSGEVAQQSFNQSYWGGRRGYEPSLFQSEQGTL